jgi:CTP synthase
LRVAIAGKYTALEDSYASVVESLLHCERNLGVNIEIFWLETSEKINEEEILDCDAVIVPGGFGSRGVEGKLEVIRLCRENEIPYLGICYGLQLAVVEFLRNVCAVKDAVSLEFDSDAKNPAITLLDEQKQVVRMGGTMRLGAYEAHLKDSQIKELYKELGEGKELKSEFIVSERHRHRYEVNPDVIEKIEKEGLNVVGYSAERKLVEFIELDSKKHPYFVGTQAHPELKSRLDKPAPLFFGLIQAALRRRESLAKQVSEHHKK